LFVSLVLVISCFSFSFFSFFFLFSFFSFLLHYSVQHFADDIVAIWCSGAVGLVVDGRFCFAVVVCVLLVLLER
jgi:hypothetical protein